MVLLWHRIQGCKKVYTFETKPIYLSAETYIPIDRKVYTFQMGCSSARGNCDSLLFPYRVALFALLRKGSVVAPYAADTRPDAFQPGTCQRRIMKKGIEALFRHREPLLAVEPRQRLA